MAVRRRGNRVAIARALVCRSRPRHAPASHGVAHECADLFRGEQAGYATSGGWSPLLKKYVALAHLQSKWAAPGTRLEIEITVEHRRKRAGARVVKKPFFDPSASVASYDAVVIGAGHNSLVCAAYLARAVAKYSSSSDASASAAPRSPRRCSRDSFFGLFLRSHLLRPEIIRELELPRHGLHILPLESTFTRFRTEITWRSGTIMIRTAASRAPFAARRRGVR